MIYSQNDIQKSPLAPFSDLLVQMVDERRWHTPLIDVYLWLAPYSLELQLYLQGKQPLPSGQEIILAYYEMVRDHRKLDATELKAEQVVFMSQHRKS